MQRLLAGIADAPCVFVVGKGGTGKTTTAGALALRLADSGRKVHLLTTDPAESLSDLFGVALTAAPSPSPCTDALTLEAFDARSWAERWLEPRRPALAEIVERGTYLEQADVDRVLALAVPGIDEAMGALRLVELAGAREPGVIDHLIVDTAPTGHTLRLLDAGSALATWVATLRAMAHKAAVVASSLLGADVRLAGERVLDAIDDDLVQLDALLLGSTFVVVHRGGDVVRAETERLADELIARGLHISAFVATGSAEPLAEEHGAAPQLAAPILPDPAGCTGLRQWMDAVAENAAEGVSAETPAPVPAPVPDAKPGASSGATAAAPAGRPAAAWLRARPWRLIWFAGKGGVGKSTCAAAAALGLSEDRAVALHSTDPAGSLSELLAQPVGADPTPVADGLRAQQVDAAAEFDAWREAYRADVAEVFEHLGIEQRAELDRRVLESALDLAPLGMDEIVSLERIIESIEGDETLVIDTAPTGHFLRLLEMPGLALDWTHALLRILLHHGAAGSLDDVSQRVLAFAKRLKVLRATLADPERAAVFIVTLDEPMVRAETDRLRMALQAAAIPEAAVIVNRVRAAPTSIAGRVIRAPELARAPVGPAALRSFFEAWELA